MKFVLIDIDHTISDATWRNALLPPNGSYDDYHAQLINDRPHENVIELINNLSSQRYTCLGISARPEKWRDLSNQWFMKHKCNLSWFLLRPNDDYSSVVESKIALMEISFNEIHRKDIHFYIDDRDDCCAAITKKYGITSFQVRRMERS